MISTSEDAALNGAPKSVAAKKPKAGRMAGIVQIVVPQIDIRMMKIKLVGDSSLVTHAWSEKAKRMMLDKQMKVAMPEREAKDPHADFVSGIYAMTDEKDESGVPLKCGAPTIAFKAAAVDACSFVSGVTKVEARGAFHVPGDLVEIKGDRPVMREDMVRVGMGTADIRHRPEFVNWHVELMVRYNASVLSPDQIVNLFNVAGFAIGVGEHRPECNGSWGMFHVARGGE